MKANKKAKAFKAVRGGDSYFRFLFGRRQWADWAVILLATFLGLFLVRLSYPFPNTASDSFGYLACAFKDEFVAYRPFGYSYYLQVLYKLSHSIYSVAVSQAVCYGLSIGLLMMAVKKYWPPRNKVRFLLFEALVSFSPAALYMLNTILSDSLFCCLVFVLVAMVIVWIQEGSWVALCIYALALFAAMHTRYSAMFFPLVFVPVFALKGNVFQRIVPIVATAAVFLVFHAGVSSEMEKLTHKRQFSTGFDGWQLANNALHMLPHMDKEELMQKPPTEEMQMLHIICLANMPKILEYTHGKKRVTASFMWAKDSPLKEFTDFYLKRHEEMYYYDAWIALGSGLYRDYGIWLITHHPWKFIRYYLFPNSLQAFFPDYMEVFDRYIDIPAEKKEITQWFTDAPKDGLHARNEGYGKFLKLVLPWLELLTWLMLFASLILLIVRKTPLSRETKLCLLLIFLFGFIYYSTTVFASPIAARYWMPMHAIKLSFVWIAWRASIKAEK